MLSLSQADLIYSGLGILVFAIALVKRELLIRKKSFTIVFAISVLLFVTAFLLHFTLAPSDSGCGALMAPLLSLGLFRLFRRIFMRVLKREPANTWFTWTQGMAADRLFNICFFVLALWLVPLTAMAFLELSKAGW